ncbi:MAG: copper resistance protein NlpE [Ginsengibacter sp.]
MKTIKISMLALASFMMATSCNTQFEEKTENVPETAVTSPAPDMHTSHTALDWDGTYVGMLPCADCEGIETTLVLNKDLTFERISLYKGKKGGKFTDAGSFSFDSTGNVVTLIIEEENPSYKVKEGKIVLLNQSGEENTGELAEFYVLKKK